jgi:hypothetical protein
MQGRYSDPELQWGAYLVIEKLRLHIYKDELSFPWVSSLKIE